MKYLLIMVIICSLPLRKGFAQFNTISMFGTVKSTGLKRQFDSTPSNGLIAKEDIIKSEAKPATGDSSLVLFSCPLGRKMQYSSKFGLRIHPVLHNVRMHNGVDIEAYYEPVLSVADGIIRTVARGEKEGIFIVITHGNIESIYAHLSNVFVSCGQVVKPGEQIATSGNTGMSTGAHLHFGMKYKGKYFDPHIFLDGISHLNLKYK